MAPESVLFVCSANRCRSPLAAALLRADLKSRVLDVVVDSAGVRAREGQPAMAELGRLAAERGLDLRDHRSTTLDGDRIARATVVLAMERSHVRDVVTLDAAAWPKTFTVKEAVRRGSLVGPRAPEELMAAWLARVHAGRSGAALLGTSTDDDIADPVTSRATSYVWLVAELNALLEKLVPLGWPTGPSPSPR